MTYASETWAPNRTNEETLAVSKRKMERIMLGITLPGFDSEMKDIIAPIKKGKYRYASHVSCLRDGRWTTRLTDWTPMLEV